ncbi:murein hydrolase activator EnvC family protein [Anaerovorax odorimutans]|uniref:murein hydrolase activator EnvC family protein n=1 Tax=Anaerovorax odorimutans TaxID=109327 RepID=UPI0003FE1082|nr:peptidoglycan DD-metalloendopeptidase family protein [Anaerovorax odorimutans]
MKKRLVSYTLLFLLIASVLSLGAIYADKNDDLNKVKSQMNQKQSELNKGKNEEKKLSNQIKDIESQIKKAEAEVSGLQGDIDETEGKISKVKQELEKVETEMEDQNDNLNKRLRAMYMNGDSSFLEILLGSEDITDFITNMDMITKIFENDVNILKTIEAQLNQIEVQKNELEQLQAKLEKSKDEEAQKQLSLQDDRNKVASLKADVAADNAELQKQMNAMAAEADRLTAEINALQGNSGNTQYTGSGKLAWPVPGQSRVTSEFTNRINPITGKAEKHLGIDIAAPTGTSIVAAESGTVIKAGYNNSYGYMVIIDHGGGIATVYGHNSRLAVSVGTVVARGQTISYAGSTGMSTGPHLHFEVRVNGQYQNPRNWL